MNTSRLTPPHYPLAAAVCLAIALALSANAQSPSSQSAQQQAADRLTKQMLARKYAGEQSDPAADSALIAKQDLAARYPRLIQRLESRLLRAWQVAVSNNPTAAATSLADLGVRVQGTNVTVIVQCESNASPHQVAELLAVHNVVVVREGEAHVKAVVPILAMEKVANLPGVSFVRLPIRPRTKNTVITEGRAATLASSWHISGFTGQGVKIAIIDVGFANLSTLKANGEIPVSAVGVDFTETGMESGTDAHGCACAEIIYDMAPGVQMYLIKTEDPSDDEAAKNYCKAQGIKIISQSAGYDALNFHDGVAYTSISPHPITIVNDANANGILWVNAAGNEQLQHALIQWRDGNVNDYLDWTPGPAYDSYNELWNGGDPIPAGTFIDLYLTWNSWPVTSQDFDLKLYRDDGVTITQVASSPEYQTGIQPPRDHLVYTTTMTAHYYVRIYRYNATTSPWFILRSYPFILYYYGFDNVFTPVPGSITIPGDAASAFTVGSIDYANYTSGPIERYSSLGPNNGAYTGKSTVVKPDICGPSSVSTDSFGPEGFGGTSASTPHIAGLVALVKQRFPSYSNTQIRSYLASYCIDLGTAGKDNTFGAGPCVMPQADTVRPSVSIAFPTGTKTYTNAQTVTIQANASDNIGVSRVDFYDGPNYAATDTESPYTYDWAFTVANNGTHNWTASASDAAGNVTTSGSVALVVSIDTNAPTITISSPTNNQTITNSPFTVSGTAGDIGWPSNGINLVQVRVNSGSWSNATGTATWTRSMALSPCPNSIEARSRDGAGNYSVIVSNFVTYNPPNTAPNRPTNTSPANLSSNVSVTPTLTATAFSDPDCVGDTHSASQWRVLNSAGGGIVADSGTDAVNKVSWIVPTNKLYYGSNYLWHVRYRDSRNAWSTTSAPTRFYTSGPLLSAARQGTNIVLNWPTNSIGFTLQWQTNLASINWSNATPAPVVAAGKYTVTNSTTTNKSRFYRLKK